MTNENDAIKRIIYTLNGDKSLNLEIGQNENGSWQWRYWNGVTNGWDSEIYANPEAAIYGLLKWLALSLKQHDDLIYNVIARVESGEAE